MIKAKKYVPLGVSVMALQWTGDNIKEVLDFIGTESLSQNNDAEGSIWISVTSKVSRICRIGDYITLRASSGLGVTDGGVFGQFFEEVDHNKCNATLCESRYLGPER